MKLENHPTGHQLVCSIPYLNVTHKIGPIKNNSIWYNFLFCVTSSLRTFRIDEKYGGKSGSRNSFFSSTFRPIPLVKLSGVDVLSHSSLQSIKLKTYKGHGVFHLMHFITSGKRRYWVYSCVLFSGAFTI